VLASRRAVGKRVPVEEALLEALPAAIYTANAEGRITFHNQACSIAVYSSRMNSGPQVAGRALRCEGSGSGIGSLRSVPPDYAKRRGSGFAGIKETTQACFTTGTS
jgi:hypothetical protein